MDHDVYRILQCFSIEMKSVSDCEIIALFLYTSTWFSLRFYCIPYTAAKQYRIASYR
jgi:hypothetical protein